MDDVTVLQHIDSKLGALLALAVDRRLREAGARTEPVLLDQLLSESGL